MLDSLSLDESFRGTFLQALIKISRETGLYPDGLLQHGVTLRRNGLIISGGYRAVWKGTYKGQNVAVKVPSLDGYCDIMETLKVSSFPCWCHFLC